MLNSTSVPVSSDRRRWQIFASCAVAIFFVWLDSTSMPAMLPVFRRFWPEASAQELGWVLNAYSISFAVLLVPMGWVSDRLGSLKLLSGGLVLYCLTSTICAFTTSLEVTIAARMAQGVAAASLPPSALSLALRNLPDAQHGRAMYFWAAVGGIAAILGPLFAGIALNGGYRLFYGLHVLAGVAALVSLYRLRTCMDRTLPRRSGDRSAAWPEIRRPGFLFLQLGTLCFGCAFSLILLDAQTIFTRTLGFSSQISLAHLSIAIVLCVLTSIGLAFSAIGRKRMALAQAGVGITAVAGWLMVLLDCPPFSAAILFTLALAGIGLGMTLPNLPSISAHLVSARSQGLANAVNQSSRHLGSAIAVSVSQQVGNPAQSLGLILTACCLSSAVLLLLSMRGSREARPQFAH